MLTIPVDEEIVLRSPTLDDAQTLFDLIERNRSHLTEWLGYVRFIRSVEGVENFIKGRIQEEEEESSFELLVEYRGAVVGRVWISRLKEFENRAELSYWLGREVLGLGIMTRSCRAATKWLFEERKVNRVEIAAARPNKKSTAIAERLGFTLEGYIRDGTLVNGNYYDHASYSILAREWRG